MSLRTLLLVSYHFPPSGATGSYRLIGFTRHLLAHGWRTVIVAPPSMPYEIVDEQLLKKLPPEAKIYSAPYPKGTKLTRKLFSHKRWLPIAMKACAEAIAAEHPDAILTSSPPHEVHWLGRWLKWRYGLPWIADYRDPWMYGQGKPIPQDLAARWKAWQERFLLQGADTIIANTPLACSMLQKDLPDLAGKMSYITNGFDPENFTTPVAPKTSNKLSILHPGEIYWGRDPRVLFDVLSDLQSSSHIKLPQVDFIMRAASDIDWPAEVSKRGLTDVVHFSGSVSYDESLKRMQQADILLLLDSPDRRVGVPAKLFEYLGARRPILALVGPQSEAAWALKQSSIPYRCAAPGDKAQIRQALLELLAEVAKQDHPVPPFPEQFTRAYTAGQLARLLEQTAITAR